MITINEFINKVTNSEVKTSLMIDVQKNNIQQNHQVEQDKFEKEDTKKINKKKINIIIASLITAVALIVAIVKRKEIKNFFSKTFKKGKGTIPPEKPSFPTPKFSSNPTIKQRDEYINSIAGLIYDKDGQVRKQTLQMIKKYGINDVTRLQDCFDDSSEENIRLTLMIFAKWGKNDDVFAAIDPISRSKIKITEDETYIEILKTIQKLAHLDKETPKDREIIIEPVRKLLNHKSEQVRKIAQETIDMIDIK